MQRLILYAIFAALVEAQHNSAAEPEALGVVYIIEPGSGSLMATEKAVAESTQTLSEGTSRVQGDRASIRVEANPKIQFALKLKAGKKAASYALFEFGSDAGDRIVSFKRSGLRNLKWIQGRQITFKVDQEHEVFRLTPLEPLGPGE